MASLLAYEMGSRELIKIVNSVFIKQYPIDNINTYIFRIELIGHFATIVKS